MPSLKNRNSWPQLRRLHRSQVHEPIDSDPFAYFVSPAEDRMLYVEGSLTAGINIRTRSRSLPTFHPRKPRIILSMSTSSRSPTARLKKWIERMEKQYFHHSYRHHRDADLPDPIIRVIEPRPKPSIPGTEPVVITISPPLRGRGDVRTGSAQRRARDNGRTPPRRPRVWREPSADIWTVAEEDEEARSGLGITV